MLKILSDRSAFHIPIKLSAVYHIHHIPSLAPYHKFLCRNIQPMAGAVAVHLINFRNPVRPYQPGLFVKVKNAWIYNVNDAETKMAVEIKNLRGLNPSFVFAIYYIHLS